ncbi:MAG TPA: SRPBCC family protein [Mycobacteriales bacterium]|nr:SRPBCC family protein [Mycobacteriales bacterium]
MRGSDDHGTSQRSGRSNRRRMAAAAAAVLGITALGVLAAARLSRRVRLSRVPPGDGAIRVESRVTVNRTLEEAYAFWRDLSRLASFMTHLESVSESASPDGDRRSHWTAGAPGGGTVEWDAVLVQDVVGELISWRSVEVAEVTNSGAVRFRTAPGGRGTEVLVELVYEPPAGPVGATVATLLGEEPQQQLVDDLRRFKQIIETGEVVRSEGSPEGTRAGRLLRQRPAQPVA